MRRRPGALIPIEVSILAAGIDLFNRGEVEFHGYQLATEIRHRNGDHYRTAAGTLYKALDRLEKNGLLASRWENEEGGRIEGRPPRRLYRLNAAGRTAYERTQAATDAGRTLRPGRRMQGEPA